MNEAEATNCSAAAEQLSLPLTTQLTANGEAPGDQAHECTATRSTTHCQPGEQLQTDCAGAGAANTGEAAPEPPAPVVASSDAASPTQKRAVEERERDGVSLGDGDRTRTDALLAVGDLCTGGGCSDAHEESIGIGAGVTGGGALADTEAASSPPAPDSSSHTLCPLPPASSECASGDAAAARGVVFADASRRAQASGGSGRTNVDPADASGAAPERDTAMGRTTPPPALLTVDAVGDADADADTDTGAIRTTEGTRSILISRAQAEAVAEAETSTTRRLRSALASRTSSPAASSYAPACAAPR